MRKIRVRVAGIYVEDGKILLVKHRKHGREYYLLPGGGQEPGESTKQALAREWKEELNLSVKVGGFLFFGESVPASHLRASQVMQLVFKIESTKETIIKVNKDGALFDYAWVAFSDLSNIAFFPACLEQVQSIIYGKDYPLYQKYKWLT